MTLIVMVFSILAAADEPAREPAIRGYCPVSYFTKSEAVKGDPAQSAVYGGQLYYFANDAARRQFLEDPIAYVPQFDGLCTTALGGSYGNRLPSDSTVFDVRDEKLYLFGSPRAKLSYDGRPEQFIEQAKQRFAKPAYLGNCLVSSRREGMPIAGTMRYSIPYHGWMYHFKDEAALGAFLADPDSFLPQYKGFCAVGVSHQKRYPADGSRLRVVEGKTYLLFDEAAAKEFDAGPAAVIKKADANWPALKDQKD